MSPEDSTVAVAYDRLFPKIYAYVAFRVGRQQDAEDIVSEAFLRAVENLDRFEPQFEGSMEAWLFTIARNLVKNHYRRNSRKDEPLTDQEITLTSKSTDEPDEILDRKERYFHLRVALGTLGPRYQEVITLKFFGGLRNQEIASVLQLKERTVAAYLVRGLKLLQAKYSSLMMDSGERIGNEDI
ncbi:MAG: RNA polymerase sigma factor [Chloroflexi bacterium]|nr:MAG: RNA polymerase sigma factor [Chloroflexota bacterium]MBL1193827.1 RNA polymerase sigma factor [Chloroflexota bacterium]NOH11121.1 RNA polymerase sigma factor [Chloroflexota bacterium]